MHIKFADYVSDFFIWATFNDGISGKVNLDGVLKGTVFETLKDQEIFSKLSVDPELETVVWPSGADLAPEFLKELHEKQKQT